LLKGNQKEENITPIRHVKWARFRLTKRSRGGGEKKKTKREEKQLFRTLEAKKLAREKGQNVPSKEKMRTPLLNLREKKTEITNEKREPSSSKP